MPRSDFLFLFPVHSWYFPNSLTFPGILLGCHELVTILRKLMNRYYLLLYLKEMTLSSIENAHSSSFPLLNWWSSKTFWSSNETQICWSRFSLLGDFMNCFLDSRIMSILLNKSKHIDSQNILTQNTWHVKLFHLFTVK